MLGVLGTFLSLCVSLSAQRAWLQYLQDSEEEVEIMYVKYLVHRKCSINAASWLAYLMWWVSNGT